MNCRLAQKKIVESFAAASAPPPEVSAHRQACAECQSFYETNRRLFESLDAGLRNMVSQPVPASLSPRVCARLDESSSQRATWNPRWSFGAVAAAVVLALGLAILRNHFASRDVAPEPSPVASTVSAPPSAEATAPRSASHELYNRKARKKTSRPSPAKSSDAMPQVIVLVEERQAFARFVADRSRRSSAVLPVAATHLDVDDPVIEIAPLEIATVEITPLESLNGE